MYYGNLWWNYRQILFYPLANQSQVFQRSLLTFIRFPHMISQMFQCWNVKEESSMWNSWSKLYDSVMPFTYNQNEQSNDLKWNLRRSQISNIHSQSLKLLSGVRREAIRAEFFKKCIFIDSIKRMFRDSNYYASIKRVMESF